MTMTIVRTMRKMGLPAVVAASAMVWGGLITAPLAHASSAVGSKPVAGSDLIKTTDGPIKGKIDAGVRQFLGIPYAAPPVGKLRWRPPQPPAHWRKTKKTVAYGDTCAQSDTLGVFAAKSQSEDCLYLNVFAPKNTDTDAALPVMVWIHGGGLFDGESNDYDGSRLVKQGHVIVVTINYRLNIFGFLALPGLDHEGHKFANYGFMDQQFALKWVQNNIAAFGGDPDNVTIFGESAGGRSVLANLISPTAKGLFNRGIVESGSGVATKDVASAEARGKAFAKAVGCNRQVSSKTVSCLRSLSVKKIQAKAPKFAGEAPITLDGTVLKEPLHKAIRSGDFNQVPVIDGSNRDEARFFVGLAELTTHKTLKADQYPEAIRNGIGLFSGLGAHTSQILDQYPLNHYSSPSLAIAAVYSDQHFVCPHLSTDRLLARHVPTYVYQFADRSAPSYAPSVSFPYGAYHTSEIQYLFPLYHGGQGTPHPLKQAQKTLSKAMVSYWTSFARSGDPNSSAAPHWPRYKAGNYQSLGLPKPQAKNMAALSTEHHCDFWNKLQQ